MQFCIVTYRSPIYRYQEKTKCKKVQEEETEVKNYITASNVFLVVLVFVAGLDFWHWIEGASHVFIAISLLGFSLAAWYIFGKESREFILCLLILFTVHRAILLYLVALTFDGFMDIDAFIEGLSPLRNDRDEIFLLLVSTFFLHLVFLFPAFLAIAVTKAEFGTFKNFFSAISAFWSLFAIYVYIMLAPIFLSNIDPIPAGFIKLNPVYAYAVPFAFFALVGYFLISRKMVKSILVLPGLSAVISVPIIAGAKTFLSPGFNIEFASPMLALLAYFEIFGVTIVWYST